MLFATLRALIATAVMIPIGIRVLGSIPWRWSGAAALPRDRRARLAARRGLGLVLGTLVKPNRINIVFSLVFTPLLFTGCSQYPWPSLARLRWFQVVTALNPMTYVSEGLRAALVPSVPHIAPWICLLVLAGCARCVLLAIGIARLLPPRDRLSRPGAEYATRIANPGSAGREDRQRRRVAFRSRLLRLKH